MSTSWVLLLAACFSGEEIWVYVEDDPQDRSQHVLDALQTPIQTLKERFPSPACQKYLWQLSCDRHDLREQCTVHLVTRDEASIPSYIELPGYSFSPREYPSPLHSQVYLHWQLVPRHLRYLSQIKEYEVQNWGFWSNWKTVDDKTIKRKWFIVAEDVFKFSGEVGGYKAEITETVERYYFRFPPEPPIILESLPYVVYQDYVWETPDAAQVGKSTTRYLDSPERFHKIVELMDMGTGIINQNKETP